jgi:6-pyruvoyltetrahydropterin/6-carboxytetrahydropterin synthase
MYELSVERDFCAAHALTILGRAEPVHGHNWHVTVVVRGERLNADGLLCDFHLLERLVDRVIGPLDNADLNSSAAFAGKNPTAEEVARHIATAVAATVPKEVRMIQARVAEAPGCTATYWIEEP